MDETLTPERVLEIGREWKRILIQHTPPEEMDTLLSDEYKQHFIEQGVEQGIEQGIYRTLTEILNHHLGEILPAVDERLRTCTLAQLNTLVNPALDAATWEEFAVYLPVPPDNNEV